MVSMFITACIDSAPQQTETTTQNLNQASVTPTVYVPPVGSGSVRYILDWNLGKAVFADDESSWSAETETGYRVTLTEGSLTSATVQLVDCIESQTTQAFSLVNVASAGHGDTVDPTLISGPFIESLTQPISTETSAINDLGASYCQAHYVVSGQTSTGLPSLTIAGSWQNTATGESGSFDIDTALAWGQVHPLDDVVSFADGQQMTTVTVTRELGALFDTADFVTMTDSELARAILRQLTQTTSFTLSTGDEW